MATLFLCPPEILLENWPPTKIFLHSSRLSCLIVLSIWNCLYTSEKELSFNAAWKAKVSSTVKVPNKISSCLTYAAFLENYYIPKHCPLSMAEPSNIKSWDFFVILAVMIERNDDLPAPEGPITVRNSPDYTEPLRLCRIVFRKGR